MKTKRRIFLLTSIAAGFSVAVACLSGPVLAQGKPGAKGKGKPQRVTRVVVDMVRKEPMRQTVPVLGRFVARRSGPVAARAAGAIGEFHVDVGDRVKEGDLISVLMKERLQWQHNLKRAEVSFYAAQVRTKKRQIKLLQQELDRLRSLRKSPAFSQARLEDKLQQVSVAESGVSEADAKLRMANANLKLTGISLHDAEIRAPYGGVISKRHAEVGAYVGIGAPVVTIIDDQTMEIEADVPALRTLGLTPNTIVSAVLENKTRIDAAVRAIIPEENPRTRTRAVRFIPAFGGETAVIAANQSVTLQLPSGLERDVITVHKDAVVTKKGRRVVFIADHKRAQMRPVTLGEATGSRFSVINGLKPGNLVVIRGNERLRPGAPLAFELPPGAAGIDNAAPDSKKPAGKPTAEPAG